MLSDWRMWAQPTVWYKICLSFPFKRCSSSESICIICVESVQQALMRRWVRHLPGLRRVNKFLSRIPAWKVCVAAGQFNLLREKPRTAKINASTRSQQAGSEQPRLYGYPHPPLHDTGVVLGFWRLLRSVWTPQCSPFHWQNQTDPVAAILGSPLQDVRGP